MFDTEMLYKEINDIADIFNETTYSEFIVKSAYLREFNFLNQVMIFRQNRLAIDVRNEHDWAEIGCIIKNNDIPINIITPIKSTVYIDNEIGTEVASGDLTNTDINAALNLGIIRKEYKVVGYENSDVYDITQIKVIDDEKFSDSIQINKSQSIKLSGLLKMCNNITDMTIEKGKTTWYNYNTNTLMIGNEPVEHKFIVIIKSCIESLLNNSNILSNTINFKIDALTKQFIVSSVCKAITRYCTINNEDTVINAEEVYSLHYGNECTEIVDIMNLIIDIIYIISYSVDIYVYEKKADKQKINMGLMNKAERLLNILEAHHAKQKISKLKFNKALN